MPNYIGKRTFEMKFQGIDVMWLIVTAMYYSESSMDMGQENQVF